MKFSLWTQYGAQNSRPVFDAFAHSLMADGHDVVWNDPVCDVDVIWSVLFSGRINTSGKGTLKNPNRPWS